MTLVASHPLRARKSTSAVVSSVIAVVATVLGGAFYSAAGAQSSPATNPNEGAPALVLPIRHGKFDAIFVDTHVNGRPAVMLLDTGARMTVVRPELVDMNPGDLAIARFRHGPGFGGDAVPYRTTVRIGTVTWRDHAVVVMNLTEVNKMYERDVDGLLGEDLLCKFSSVRLDFKQRLLSFYK